MNLDPENMDPAKWGGGLAALVGVIYGIRKMMRTDKQESSSTEVIVSVNGGTKLLIDEFKAQLAAMAQRLKEVEQELRNYFQLHEACQQEMKILRLENDHLRKNQKL